MTLLLILKKCILLRKRRKHNMWMRRIFMERSRKGFFNVLVKDLKLFDSVAPFISKSSLRRAVATAEERLCIALRYLVTGDALITIAISFRMSPITLGRIIIETCKVIWNVICKKGYLLAPSSQKEWLRISSEFYERWNFPHCLGAIDGKHVIIQSPARSGSMYFNYKKTFSIVLLATCNAKYEFTLVDIGGSGRQSDGSIYNNSKVVSAIDNNLLNFPDPSCISGYSKSITFRYTFLADEAFALQSHMMRPYPRRTNLDKTEIVFNYRLSRGSENSFGVLASRFRIFRRPIVLKVENVKIVVKATVALHNFLMKIQIKTDNFSYCPSHYVDQETSHESIPGKWRKETNNYQGLKSIQCQGAHNFIKKAKSIRNKYKDYFNSEEGLVLDRIFNSTSNPFDEE
ncbi:uncharacterized protein LOC136088435 [Hydra vulgaris]|uniref:Uncharacterized protein LOC136088435 n=1 Tax=Hydra vulgaris TaxID=6087 RepID=A0ABM4D1V7_HYDVU